MSRADSLNFISGKFKSNFHYPAWGGRLFIIINQLLVLMAIDEEFARRIRTGPPPPRGREGGRRMSVFLMNIA